MFYEKNFGAVVQSVRMLPCQGRGYGFESRQFRKSLKFKLLYFKKTTFYYNNFTSKYNLFFYFLLAKIEVFLFAI